MAKTQVASLTSQVARRETARCYAGVRLAVVGFAAVSLWGCSYNNVSTQDEAVKAEWAEVQKEVQRRNDLVPRLVEAVKRSASREESVIQAVTESRARLEAARTPVQTFAAANKQWAALTRLTALVEKYPELKADDSFKRLTDELADVEKQIAVGRMRYNARVQQYNASRRRFLGMQTTMRMFGYRDHPFFEIPPPGE